MARTHFTPKEHKCPGCKLRMPADLNASYDGYYNCSPECWSIYAEVLGFQFSNAVVFSQVHQLAVDAYAVQHAGGPHPDKSIGIHLAGLHAAMDLGVPQMQIPGLLQRLASYVSVWPGYSIPDSCGPMNVLNVALADTPSKHVVRVKKWAGFVWSSWSNHHQEVAFLVASHWPRTTPTSRH